MRHCYLKVVALALVLSAMFPVKVLAEGISLNGTWQLSYWKQPATAVTSPEDMRKIDVKQISATVPGNVELDLLAAGLIKDPMIGTASDDTRAWEGYQWCYRKTFATPAISDGQRVQLYFGGIDCLADVWLNGRHVGSTDNALIEHAFDVTNYLNSTGENVLEVILRSAVLEAQKYILPAFSIRDFAVEESIFMRKAPHSYGWDIMPRIVSAGLWRKVELQVQDPVRFRDVNYFVTRVDTTDCSATVLAYIQVSMPLEKFDKVKAVYTLSRKGKVVYSGTEILSTPATRRHISLKNADLWWPRGYGEPALYDAKVELVDEDGQTLAVDTRKIGLRTVKLQMTPVSLPPEQPGDFRFIVNDEPIFIHGTNWVPLDALHSRDASHYDEAIKMAADLNCNMIRCWGGNVYEDHRFYDLCDENGIMIWQDFSMGCTFYPQSSDFVSALEKEVRSVVLKLRSHPSIVLWSGNNEDDQGLINSPLGKPFRIDPNRDVVSRHLIPAVLYEYDPSRPYLPSSPYCSEEVFRLGGKQDLMPENHLWGPRGYYKDKFYTEAKCCFVSEIGYHGCPNLESLQKMMTKDCVYPWKNKDFEWNEEWICKATRRFPNRDHETGMNRNNLMINQIRLLFGEVPVKLEDFIFASQSVQAEAMKFFVEMWRGNKFEGRNGIIWWNLRDGWPIVSDAIVDYYNSKKMAYYFIRNVQKDVCVMMNDPQAGGYPLVAVNDTRTPQQGSVEVIDVASGKQVYKGTFAVAANGREVVSTLPQADGQGMYLIKYKVGGVEYLNHYLYGTPPFKLKEYKKLLQKANVCPAQK